MKIYSCWQMNVEVSYPGVDTGKIRICSLNSGKLFDIWIDMLEEANKTNQSVIVQEVFDMNKELCKELCMVFNPGDDLLDVVRYFHLHRGWKGWRLHQLLRQVKKHMEKRSKEGVRKEEL